MNEEIIILTDCDDFEPDRDSKGWKDTVPQITGKLREVKLDPARLEAQMSQFIKVVGHTFRQANVSIPPESGLQLSEVELNVKINGKGQIQLIAGAEVGGEGGITLKFKRLDSNVNDK
jgi:hypothetical protein